MQATKLLCVGPLRSTRQASRCLKRVQGPLLEVQSITKLELELPILQFTRHLFLCSIGSRKLLRPKKSHILHNDGTPVLLLNHNNEPDLKNMKIERRMKKIYDSDFIEYQSTMQIAALKQVLIGITDLKAQSLVQKYPVFNFTDAESIKDSFYYLRAQGLSLDRIMKIPWLLALKPDLMGERFEKLQKYLNIETFTCAAPFLEIPLSRLHYVSTVWKNELSIIQSEQQFSNRIYYLASILHCNVESVADMMGKVPYLMSGTLTTSILPKLRLLLDSGIKEDDIIKDPWIFTQNLPCLKERINLCDQHSLTVIKPWMLRCTKTAFNEYVKRLNEEEQLLGPHNDVKEFLTEALNCDINTVTRLMNRVPALKSASASKLNAMIQFLYSAGFTSNHILKAPNVLAHSPETVEGRISELRSIGYNKYKAGILNALCQSTKRYKNFIQRLKYDEKEVNQ